MKQTVIKYSFIMAYIYHKMEIGLSHLSCHLKRAKQLLLSCGKNTGDSPMVKNGHLALALSL